MLISMRAKNERRALCCEYGATVIKNALLALALGAAQLATHPPRVVIPGTEVALKADWRFVIVNECRYAVPAEWHVTIDTGAALAPDGSRLTMSSAHITDWFAHIKQLRTTLGRLGIVHEASAHRLWIEYSEDARREHYIAVSNGTGACIAALDLKSSSRLESTAIGDIVESVGPAPTNWPPR
jgi:hypothetical protein